MRSTPAQTKLTFAHADKICELARRWEASGDLKSKQSLEHAIEMGEGDICLRLTLEKCSRLRRRECGSLSEHSLQARIEAEAAVSRTRCILADTRGSVFMSAPKFIYDDLARVLTGQVGTVTEVHQVRESYVYMVKLRTATAEEVDVPESELELVKIANDDETGIVIRYIT